MLPSLEHAIALAAEKDCVVLQRELSRLCVRVYQNQNQGTNMGLHFRPVPIAQAPSVSRMKGSSDDGTGTICRKGLQRCLKVNCSKTRVNCLIVLAVATAHFGIQYPEEHDHSTWHAW